MMNGQRLEILTMCVAVCILYACGGGSGKGINVTGSGDPANTTQTEVFEISDFSEVAIGGPFNVSILQGSEFSVAITIDSDDVNSLDVQKSGQTLNIGFQSGVNVQVETLEAVIILPSLVRVSLAGATDAMFSGFTGSALDVELAGAAALEGLNVSYDFVMVSAVGASQLIMKDVPAIPAAHADLLAASVATLNLMDSASLIGSVSAASSLFYYGSNVVVDVNTDLSSNVQRLGGTRPN